MARRDHMTLELFPYPSQPQLVPGALDCDMVVRSTLARMIKQSPLDRAEIASALTRLAGYNVTEAMLDAYTAQSREGHRFPANLIPAITAVCDYSLMHLFSEKSGSQLLIGKEALDAELGKLEKQRDQVGQRIRALKRAMGEQS